MKRIAASFTAAAAALMSTAAFADKPVPWQTDLQQAATPIMREVRWFEEYTLWFIIPITLLVLALLIWVAIRYRASANPNPSRTSHNTLIEVIWTVGPVVILLFIAVPSFSLLTAQYTPPEEPSITIKATGYQWYWGYEYQNDQNAVSFDSVLLKEGDRGQYGKEDVEAYPRLLAVDNDVVVPVNATVRLLVTGADVIHSFAMQSFGVKVDAVPGRVNETWFKVEKPGIYYGQCSELCGKDHAYMPIAIRAVSQEQYDAWIASAGSDLEGANKALMASIKGGTKVADAGAAAVAK
ncbi:cytochrome c oxidase subunit II [Zhengella mangrovi]|uniref:Cytochrome c oxidase subunit 2 n=1 Tax=Zhengella mangrovi TaxID=1982044 RepID=A0A2G1QNM2_9HYPH|nr:cytochrome c oxidase subunit II [Zhengella mangrovi]PHP67123.1 cytochrome c oxidase subunit II [Zhengella mangrovi]